MKKRRSTAVALTQFGPRLRILPIIAAAVSFGSGIWIYQQVPDWLALGLILLSSVGVFALAFAGDRAIAFARIFRIAFFSLGFAGLGMWTMGLNTRQDFYDLVRQHPDAVSAWVGVVSKPGQLSTSGREWTVVEASRAKVGGIWLETEGNVRISRDTNSRESGNNRKLGGKIFQAGDVVAIIGPPKAVLDHDPLIGPPFNQIMRRKGIFLKAFISADKAKSLTILKRGNPLNVKNMAGAAANWTSQTLYRYLGHGREGAVAAALTVGDKQDIDGETRADYAAAGTLHILAVSGMHVGLIYQMLLGVGLLLPLSLQGNRRRNISLAVIVLLWGFAFITGLQASIVRAVVMFCLVELGRIQGRDGRPIDMLALAALIMLAVAPYQIYDLGFQLSFAAMAGIFLLYKPLESIFTIKNLPLRLTWQAACLTLAAQAGATPISLFHFHQFPTYFLPVNIPAVWLSGIGLYGCLAILFLSWWPWLASLLALPVKGILYLTNTIMHLAASMPAALLQGIYIEGLTCVLLVATGALILFWLAQPKRQVRLIASVAGLCGLCLLTSWSYIKGVGRSGIVIMAMDGSFQAFPVRAGTLFIPIPTSGGADLSRFLQASSLRVYDGRALPTESLPIVAHIHQPGSERPEGEARKGGMLLLSGRQMFHLQEWITAQRPDSLIVAGHWKVATREKYQQQAKALGCKTIFLEEKGILFLEDK